MIFGTSYSKRTEIRLKRKKYLEKPKRFFAIPPRLVNTGQYACFCYIWRECVVYESGIFDRYYTIEKPK